MKNSLHQYSQLSCGQQALWYLHQLEPENTAYHLGICLELHGPLDESALAAAWAATVMAHPQLRARFIFRNGEPSRQIDSFSAPLRVENTGAGSLEQFWNEIAGRPFALEHEPPVRALLLRGLNGSAHLLLCAHHLVADLWSAATILQGLSARYQSRISGQPPRDFPREQMDYAEFTAAERHWLDGAEGLAAGNFWRDYFAEMNLEPMLTRNLGDGESGEVPVALGAAEAGIIRRIAQEKATTPYAVLLACYARLLGEETGRGEIIIGTPATIRNSAALRNTVGYLVNAVPVRCPVEMHREDSIDVVAANALAARRHRRFPFPALVERLGIPRLRGTTPVFQSMFAYQSLPRANRGLLSLALRTDGAEWEFGGGITAKAVAMPAFDAQFPVALTLGPAGKEFVGTLQYDGRRVTATKAANLAKQFPDMVREFLTGRKPRSNGAASTLPVERLEHLFDQTAGEMPGAIATSENGVNLSYAEVRVRAETFAAGINAALRNHGGPVALQMPSCAEASILILAILKSGRAFLPVDPGEPAARRNAALLRADAAALLSPPGINPGTLPQGVMALDPGKLSIQPPAETSLQTPSQTAYLVYTSGSTGEPKAVEVEHAAVINHARAMARIFNLTPRDRVLQFHTLAFDAAFEEIFPSWLAGACVVFEPAARNLNLPAFLEMTRRNEVTVLNLPTSYWHVLTAEAGQLKLHPAPCLRLLIVGGEPACPKAFSAWQKLAPDCRWINTYGPTEATISALSYEPSSSRSRRGTIPIGKPVDGVTTLLLNEAGDSILTGEGELLIGGKGLALGYHGDPETTAAKFVTRICKGGPQRFFRTGDRVRLRRDGNFEFLGRLDRQLKIRGCRVDPDEIEQALCAHPSVIEAVVLPQETEGELILTGWIRRADDSLMERELRAHLLRRLPTQMVPSQLNFVTRLPRKPGGKVDHTALARVSRPQKKEDDGGPVEMADLFSELLGHEVGPQDDFFLSGGHSLLAIKLLGRVEARFGARINVADFVAAPTPQGLWSRLHAAAVMVGGSHPEPVLAETPVSAQQKRALLAHEIGLPSLANVVQLLRINGHFDEGAFQRAVEKTAKKNFLLRAGFFRTNVGIVLREAEFPRMERHYLPVRGFKKFVVNLARQEGAKPFALDGQKPWFRLLLVSTRESQNRHLILITHHAIADGWAFELLFDDLNAAYAQECGGSGEPPKSGRDYRAYARQQARWLESHAAREQVVYWKKRLSGLQEPRLPFRLPASPDASWKVERNETTLSLRLSHDFRQVAASYGTTPFVLAMACFKALVHRYSGQSDITLGTVISSRSTSYEQNVFGPLQNPVLIRNEVTSNLSMRALAQRVAHSVTEAQDSGVLPFEQFREALPRHSAVREGGIQFLSHDSATRTLRLGAASLRPIEQPSLESPFELLVAVSTAAARIKITFEYQPSAYSATGMEHLSRQYAALLQAVVNAPNALVGELNMIPARELRVLQHRVAKKFLPQVELLHEGFESQVRKNPKALAFISQQRRLTYGELNAMSESTARALAGSGLKAGGLVAVMLPKGWEQVVACLAVLKAGGVYVPLDPGLPAARLESIFEQGGFHAAIVADANSHAESWALGLPSVMTLASSAECVPAKQMGRTEPYSLAYIIFTSGTTGIPKGVMVSHQAAMTTIAEINRRNQIRSKDRVFAVSALGFDLSVFDIFGTLRAGGTIVMPDSPDPNTWLSQVIQEKVTVWNSVPCLFELLLNEAVARNTFPETLRLILLSGDVITLSLARRARATLRRARLVSLGGATEGAIWSIARELEEIDPAWHRVPYGRALQHQEMFVLDGALNHRAAGVTGELFIAGAGLANGYWRNRKETKRRFLYHPRWNLRLYRTGDQGRYLENGEIEILGRMDEQVKINGVRLELGEVEAALGSHPSVRQALVEVRADAAGNKNLVAFVAARPETNGAVLQAHLQKTLPTALTPSAWVMLARLPLTQNGKVDRTALCAMPLPVSTNTAPMPENSTELWIAGVWRELLDLDAVGREDDFFALGGHSLLAIKMLQRVRSHFAVDIPISLIAEHPTVRGLAAAVQAAATAPEKGLPQRATAELEPDSEPEVVNPVARIGEKHDAILLTGATGHLGLALLLELLGKTDGTVYCLVRAKSKQEAEARLSKVLRPRKIGPIRRRQIVAVPADLSRERFGLAPAAFVELAREIRTIYHCAAEVNFIAPYEKLAASNVGGVREIIRLATAAGAVLHHVSSVAVFPYGGARTLREDEDISRIQRLTGGYAQSKWTSERMVWKAMAQGLRAVVYRPAQILGRAGGSPRDLFDHALHACRTLRAVPDIEARIDLVTPEYAAAAIYSLSTRESSLGRAFHLVHPEPVSLRDFVRLFPAPLPLVSLDSWLAFLNQEARRGDDPSLHFVSMLAQGLGRAELTPPGFDCSGTTAGLRGTGIVCPALDRQFVRRELAVKE